jgi:hypothetical protein
MTQISVVCGLVLVIELALHLPVSEVKLSLRAAAQTSSISAPLAGKRPAEVHMPAAKYSRYEVSNFSSQHLHNLYLANPQKYPSNINAQTSGLLGHADATAYGSVTLY